MDFVKEAIIASIKDRPGMDTVDLGHEVYQRVGVTVDITLNKAEELIKEGVVEKKYDWLSHTQYFLT